MSVGSIVIVEDAIPRFNTLSVKVFVVSQDSDIAPKGDHDD